MRAKVCANRAMVGGVTAVMAKLMMSEALNCTISSFLFVHTLPHLFSI